MNTLYIYYIMYRRRTACRTAAGSRRVPGNRGELPDRGGLGRAGSIIVCIRGRDLQRGSGEKATFETVIEAGTEAGEERAEKR